MSSATAACMSNRISGCTIASDRLPDVRAARRHLAASGPRSVRSDGDFERVSLPHADADALRDLLVAARVTTVVEVGLAYGTSALAIAEALLTIDAPNSQHVII